MGMLMAFYMAVSRAPRWGLSKDIAADLVFLLFITGVIGARLFYVWQHFEEYGSNPLEVFSIQEGGLVWYGGFVCAVAGGFVYAAVRKIPIEKWLDFFAPIIPLAHASGRLGCFLNGCCFGKFTQSGLGIFLPGEGAGRLPVQLYEFAYLILLSAFLFVYSSRKHREGTVFMGYVAAYSLGRFLLEFLRGDQTPVFFLSVPPWSSLFLFAVSGGLLIFLKRKAS